jgi:hypothetical protein
MATETYASSRKRRRMTRRQAGLLAGVVALVALAVVAVEVVWPLSAGLPIGWGQYNNSQFHLHVGAPPFWNVVGDSDLNQGAVYNCTFALIASPPSEPALHTTLDSAKSGRWMGVFAAGACVDGATGAQSSLWQPTGQSVIVAEQRAPIEMETIGAPQASYRVAVALRGYRYMFVLNDPSAARAQQDMPDFLTFVRSFRYIS